MTKSQSYLRNSYTLQKNKINFHTEHSFILLSKHLLESCHAKIIWTRPATQQPNQTANIYMGQCSRFTDIPI